MLCRQDDQYMKPEVCQSEFIVQALKRYVDIDPVVRSGISLPTESRPSSLLQPDRRLPEDLSRHNTRAVVAHRRVKLDANFADMALVSSRSFCRQRDEGLNRRVAEPLYRLSWQSLQSQRAEPTRAYKSPISRWLSFRTVPCRWCPNCTGPTAVLTRRDTGWSTASSSRRTRWLRPSCRISSTTARRAATSTTAKESTATSPSSSSTPARSRRPSERGIGPGTSARYVFGTPNDGCVSRCARSPSLVSSNSPSVSASSRPTWNK